MLQTDFSVGSERLFAPITKATKEVKEATERAVYGDIPEEGKRREAPLLGVLEKIAADTEKTQAGIRELSGDIKIQRETERLGDIDVPDVPAPKEEEARQRISPIKKFTGDAITKIRKYKINELNDYTKFGETAAKMYETKTEFLRDEYKDDIIKKEDFVDWLYKIKRDITGNLKRDVPEYTYYKMGIDSYRIQQQLRELREQKQRREEQQREEEKKRREEQKQQREEEKKRREERKQRREEIRQRAIQRQEELQLRKQLEHKIKAPKEESDSSGSKTGDGYSSGHGYSVGNASVVCPGNILADISRLEVLVGGKRAGNNSPEIINEAADISRRLFQGGIMDINVYRELIEELVENHRETHGYYSD